MDKKFVLKFLAGTSPGSEFVLNEDGREIVIGRAPDVDFVIDDPRVSRRHARIMALNGAVFIEDLRSTNGIYVNAHKTLRAELKEGDRLIVGTNLLRLVRSSSQVGDMEKTAPKTYQQPQPKFDPTATMIGAPPPILQPPSSRFVGALEDVPLLDLLQLMSSGKKTGVIKIASPVGPGEIHMKAGNILYARLPDSAVNNPKKALLRMLNWENGAFEFHPPDLVTFDTILDEGTEGYILEAARQFDEIERMKGYLPPKDMKMACVYPSPSRNTLPAEHRAMLQTVEAMPNILVGLMLDMCPLPDLETYEAMIHLVRERYVRIFR